MTKGNYTSNITLSKLIPKIIYVIKRVFNIFRIVTSAHDTFAKMSGTAGGSMRMNYDLSSTDMQHYDQRRSFISRKTMEYRLEGPSSTLHMAMDIHNRQLAVASRTIFKIFNIKDEGELSGPG